MKQATILSLLLAACAAHGQAPVANRVYGQTGFDTTVFNNPALPAAARMAGPRGVAVDDTGLYVADRLRNHLLFFPASDTVATRVYGQPDYDSINYNGYGLNEDSIALPWYLDVSKAGLVAVDWRNSRTLRYPPGGTRAVMAYGAPNFYSCTPVWNGVSPESLSYPYGAAIDDEGGVYLGDARPRVLYCPPGEHSATVVYGSPDAYTDQSGCDERHINGPQGLAVDDTGLYVSDPTNNRVVFFRKGSLVASRVYGQPTFTTNAVNNGGVGPNSLDYPVEVDVDESGVYIVDQGNERVLYYPGTSTTATFVYGQESLTAASGLKPPSATTFHPSAVAVDPFSVLISDEYGARVLRFPKPYATATHMDVTAPAAGSAGVALGAITVRLLHADGSVATEYNGPVHLRLKAGGVPDCSRIGGATEAQAVAGVATFAGVRVDLPGTYVLQATCYTLDVADSAPISVGAPPAGAAADVNHDGSVTIADTVLMMRAIYGMEVLG